MGATAALSAPEPTPEEGRPEEKRHAATRPAKAMPPTSRAATVPIAGRIQAEFANYLTKSERARLSATVAKAKSRDSLKAFDKLTAMVDGQRQIVPDPPLLVRLDDLLPDDERNKLVAAIMKAIDLWKSLETDRRALFEQFRYVDMARKVVGVGSVGTRGWIILFQGRDDQDPLLLQVKEGIAVAENMDARVMAWFGTLCGATLARAHARSRDRIAIASYLGNRDTFDQALARFAEAYADQNERDYQAWMR
ncbi:MAG: DUF2252 family protein [Frankiaceae bacterium]